MNKLYLKFEGGQEVGISKEGCSELSDVLQRALQHTATAISLFRIKVSNDGVDIPLTTSLSELSGNCKGKPYLLTIPPRPSRPEPQALRGMLLQKMGPALPALNQ